MPINVTAAGAVGTHSFSRVNVNLDEDFIYFKNTAPNVIPAALAPGVAFLYTSGIGSVTGFTENGLVYVTTTQPKKLQFSTTFNGSAVNLTDSAAGSIKFNTPIVFANKLNIDASTPTNQAVKYYTNGTPLVGLTSGDTYFLKNVSISEFAGSQALYAFSSHTFTTCGKTGRVGPTQTEMRNSYNTTWDDTYISQGAFVGYQDWTVPVSGVYSFNVRGASGYDGNGSGGVGRGAVVEGRIALTKGEVITIAVGQRGDAPSSGATWGGSGGGTFVVRKTGNEPLFVAGGGSGESNVGAGRDGVLTRLGGTSTNNQQAGGSVGFGGRAQSPFGYSAAGGGFFSRGQNGSFGSEPTFGGGSFLDGLTMGTNIRVGGYGGFGGGGQSDGNRVGQSGGGGGYSGGGGARSTTANHSGGGGGSFIVSTATNVATSNGLFDGANTFNGSPISNLSTYNTGEGQVTVSLVSSFTTGNSIHPTAQDAENGTNAIAIEPAGSSYHAFVPISLDIQNDQIHSAAPHTLTNGEAVQVNFNGVPPVGITNGSIYYINTVSAFSYRLSTTPAPSFTNINLTAPSSREVATTAKLSRVVVNTATDTLTINNHGFLVDQPLRYNVGDGTAIVPLIDQATYYVAEVINANQIRLKSSLNSPTYINFTNTGTGTGHSFIFLTVNALEDTLYIPNHGLVSGQAIRYSKGGVSNVVIPGLTDNNTYYIVKIDNSIVRLATNKALSIIANITNQDPWPATGTHSLFITSLDYTTDTITLPSHGFLQGELVEYDSKGQTVVNGLTTATPYYVIFVDGDNIKLATTPENADSGTAVDLTASPAGVGRHTLRSLSKTPDGIYTITSTPSATTFTVEAAGNVPIITKVFNPRGTIDLELNTFFIPSHGFTTGTKVTYEQGDAATDVDGLTNNTDYYVVAINRDYIRLATSAENAAAGITLNISDHGTGVGHKLITDQINGNVTGSGTVSVLSGSVLVNGSGTAFSKILKVGDRFRLFPPNVTKQHGTMVFGAADVNTTTNLITKSNTYATATQVVFSAGGGTAPAPLVEGNTYFVRAVSAGSTMTLHPTSTDATNNTNVIDLTTVGTGSNFSLSAVVKTFADTDVNTTNNRILKSHNFATGDVVKFAANGGVPPTPLVDGYYYYVRAVSNTEITLHTTLNDAQNNLQAIDFSTQGTGTGFTLTNTVPVGPIIRRITAIGGDTQITVDRPYANAYNAVSYSYPTFVYVRPQGYSLHRPFDGGVEMSVGSKTSFGQIVRQTRKYFRYQSGKGIQSSCGVNFQPSIDLESMRQFSSLTVECKTRRPHGLVSGLFIVVNGAEDSYGNTSTVYNGQFQVTVVDLTTFRFTSTEPIIENRAYGFPQFYVREWSNGAVREGMFDFQNGAFFEFDGEAIYAVRRSSTQQLAGTAAALQGSELIFGTNTAFQAQVEVGDYVVMRGQSYRITEIESDTRMSIRPEYKGSSGTEKEFNPQTQVNTTTDIFTIIGHGFADRLPVIYNSIDGEPVGGMINGRTYYVDLINNNTFKLVADPDSEINVDLSSTGTTTVHSFVPAKSGIVMTKTVDTRVPQSQWNIDICDGSGPTGYNLDISRIQMAYIDYSWYGAGKIRFGFKTTDGQVQYVHEFVHNNNLFESYFRSGNLPGRYEVVTYENPTYIPYLFHWGTSVIMDGRFDDDNAYLFTGSSQTLQVTGTTAKSFASSGINLTTDLFTVQSHGFATGDLLQFQSIATNGFPGTNSLNPTTQVVGSNTRANLTNDALYGVLVNSPNLIHLTPPNVTISRGTSYAINPQTITSAQTGTTVTIVTTQPHNLSTGMYVGVYGSTRVPNGPFYVTVTNSTTFTYQATNVASPVTAQNDPAIIISEVINFTSQGNTQYTYFLYPNGSLNNTSGPNYQPLLSIRLSPSVSEGLTGKLGDRDVINRMQLRLQEIGVSTTQLVDCKVLLNPRLNNLNFVGVDTPSLTQIVEHTAQDTVSGGVQVYNFRAAGGASGAEDTTVVDVSTLFELSNSILGGDSIYPDGPDILTIAVSRLTGSATLTSAKMSWAEAQA
jgi:hypothetical protein